MASNPARIARLAAAILAAAAVSALSLAVMINLRDGEISAEARAMAHYELPAIAADGNAYIALLGLDAPSRIDPLAEGMRLAAEHDTARFADPFARQRAPQQEREGDPDQDDRLAFAGDLDAACDIFSEPCLPFALARDHAVRDLYAKNFLLIDRYREARRLPGFAAVAIADKGRADIERGNLGRVHAVLLTVAALDAQQAHAAEACSFLQADGDFWRRVLSGAATLGDKLSAFRALAENARLASELVASPVFDASACATALRGLLAPLTGAQLSLADAFRMAFVPAVRMLASWPDAAISVEPESWAIDQSQRRGLRRAGRASRATGRALCRFSRRVSGATQRSRVGRAGLALQSLGQVAARPAPASARRLHRPRAGARRVSPAGAPAARAQTGRRFAGRSAAVSRARRHGRHRPDRWPAVSLGSRASQPVVRSARPALASLGYERRDTRTMIRP